MDWTDRLRRETGENFPEKVTAFREGMAVHGRFGKPCPGLRRPGAADPVCRQRNQLLCAVSDRWTIAADRAMSRLLKDDWPRSLDEL